MENKDKHGRAPTDDVIGPNTHTWHPSGDILSPRTAGLRTNEYVSLHIVQDGGYIAQVEHSGLFSSCSLLVPPDSHVADPGGNHPLVDVGLSASLVTTFGLQKKRVRRLFRGSKEIKGHDLQVYPKEKQGAYYPSTYHDHHREDGHLPGC